VRQTVETEGFQEQLAAHGWPGNVRELRNYIERCAAFRVPMPPGQSAIAADPGPPVGGKPEPIKMARERWLRVFERAYLTDLLERSGGNVTAAARAAGIDRIHLYRLLWRNGLK